MRTLLFLLPLALLAGCSEKDRAQASDAAQAKANEVASNASQAARAKANELADGAVAKAKDLVESLWVSAQREAEQMTKDSGESALRAARGKMLDLQSQLADIKAPNELQALQQTSVETQIARLEAALDMKELRAKIDSAQSEETKKSLRRQYDEAKENYTAAMEQVEEYRVQLKERGVPMP
ncbi:hypothetical protein EON81_19810 [bacterium]|nr:MAG: hypothetical protein EON81_19810 [bacterium]